MTKGEDAWCGPGSQLAAMTTAVSQSGGRRAAFAPAAGTMAGRIGEVFAESARTVRPEATAGYRIGEVHAERPVAIAFASLPVGHDASAGSGGNVFVVVPPSTTLSAVALAGVVGPGGSGGSAGGALAEAGTPSTTSTTSMTSTSTAVAVDRQPAGGSGGSGGAFEAAATSTSTTIAASTMPQFAAAGDSGGSGGLGGDSGVVRPAAFSEMAATAHAALMQPAATAAAAAPLGILAGGLTVARQPAAPPSAAPRPILAAAAAAATPLSELHGVRGALPATSQSAVSAPRLPLAAAPLGSLPDGAPPVGAVDSIRLRQDGKGGEVGHLQLQGGHLLTAFLVAVVFSSLVLYRRLTRAKSTVPARTAYRTFADAGRVIGPIRDVDAEPEAIELGRTLGRMHEEERARVLAGQELRGEAARGTRPEALA